MTKEERESKINFVGPNSFGQNSVRMNSHLQKTKYITEAATGLVPLLGCRALEGWAG